MNIRHLVFQCFIIFCFISCAIKVPPSGGPQDLDPPHLLSSGPPNHSTSFTGNDIRLDFNEYITLNNIGSQLIVSPLLKYPVETKIRKRSLFIHIEDTLLENTTYTMNFGEGLTDNNEGNKMENFQFVFSTGLILDSLKISGRVQNAFNLKTEKGIFVLLYRGKDDSLPFLQRPLYFATTNDSGYFQINNISPGSYKMIALKESDGNYLYSKGDELIGFPGSEIDANSENININIFHEDVNMKFLKAYSEFPGKAALVFSAPADTVKWEWISDKSKLDFYALSFTKNRDTINVWYKNVFADTLNLHFNSGSINDTVVLRLFKKQESTSGRGANAGLIIKPGITQTERQHLYLPFFLQCNHPIDRSDFSMIILLEDSSSVKPTFRFSDSLKTEIVVEHKWKDKGKYSMFIPPGTFTDIYGLKNDTVQLSFSSHGETDYGSVKINFQNTDNSFYVLQLIDNSGIVYREVTTSRDSVINLINLDPSVYRIKLIHDRNKNGKWDTGNYLKNIQPEDVEFFPEGITVRANWDVEITIKAPISGRTFK